MDFRRKLSSGGESFSEGTSRFFSSVLAKKNGLMNDLSNKIESVGASAASLMKGSSSGSSLSDSEGPVFADVNYSQTSQREKNVSEKKETATTKHTVTAEVNPVQKIQKDQENEQLASSVDKNQNGRMPGKYTKRQGSYASSESSVNEEIYHSSGVNMSFDEPLYSPSKMSSAPEKVSSGIGPSWKGKKTPPQIPPPPYNPNKTGRRSSRSSCNSPKISSGHSSDSEGRYEKYATEEKSTEERVKAPSLATIKRRSSTVDEMLFDDYVEPEKEPEPEQTVEPEVAVNKRKTLLPMGDLISFDEPELEDFHPKQVVNVRNSGGRENSGEKSFPSVSSVDSSEAVFDEHGLNNQTSVDSSEPEYEHSRRLDSMGSPKSWSSDYSLDSQPDDLTVECMGFMKQFVAKVFSLGEDIPQLEKAKFGEYCQQVPGRQWFARYVNAQRVVSKKVDESIFFRLVQYFAVVLFECNESEDFVPAKNLMNMCFTFYHESHLGRQRCKNFLYSYLREQPIWQSLRFWNAAFFDAVQNERARKPVCTSEDGHDSQNDDSMFQENITFGQLGTFTSNMRAFGLSKELCLEFLRKQAVIADLKKDQIKMLKDNIEKWKDH
ncbi:uncharacterized protein LOC123549194 [Mercenaria mercenaria]|uniref:uncharacterized protein LOC123549194 n=1 Tax=Mercenaria mercenaria TaxID=6596 RepID=UPI00234F6057|nr:uncharacterized protein LOC123549194 [Mercenaria mercenaria]XP_053401573.1 uncharacterized protein LOC123549194 [Mercenaria mercenaria]XP_053401574.1 uncharacterized protein LOC123549194 [Mercenaria mercenaria]XP_053401575.1 uncharacterized protein LOC123549194 [Mercenaria mercenaria]